MLEMDFHVAAGLDGFFRLLELRMMSEYQSIEGERPTQEPRLAKIKSEARNYQTGLDYHDPEKSLPLDITFSIENQPYNTRDLEAIIVDTACRWIRGHFPGHKAYRVNVTIIDNTLDKDKLTLSLEHEFVPPEKM
jgi:hypothetical protein